MLRTGVVIWMGYTPCLLFPGLGGSHSGLVRPPAKRVGAVEVPRGFESLPLRSSDPGPGERATPRVRAGPRLFGVAGRDALRDMEVRVWHGPGWTSVTPCAMATAASA